MSKVKEPMKVKEICKLLTDLESKSFRFDIPKIFITITSSHTTNGDISVKTLKNIFKEQTGQDLQVFDKITGKEMPDNKKFSIFSPITRFCNTKPKIDRIYRLDIGTGFFEINGKMFNTLVYYPPKENEFKKVNPYEETIKELAERLEKVEKILKKRGLLDE
jgi:hypothetical protein